MRNHWVFLVRLSATTPLGRRCLNLTAPTRVPESEAKPRATTSALNAAMEHAAGRLGIDMSDVVVDWYDFVVGDEPLGSAKRSAEPSSPPAQSPPGAENADDRQIDETPGARGAHLDLEAAPAKLALHHARQLELRHGGTERIQDDDGFGYEIAWTWHEACAEFEVRDLDVTEDSAGRISLPSDELYLRGYVRWDVQTIRFGDYHWCGWKDWRKHMELLSHLYLRAFELMGVEPNEHCDAEGLAVYRAAVAARDGAERQG